MTGSLTLRIDNDGSSVRTFFDKLKPRPEDVRPGGKDPCCVKVDTKKFCTALQWQQSSIIPNISKAILCLVENEMLLVHVMLNPSSVGFLTYYVPVHFLSEGYEED
jgi:HUS1 checkpoint protein